MIAIMLMNNNINITTNAYSSNIAYDNNANSDNKHHAKSSDDDDDDYNAPNLPTKIIPTKTAWLKLSGKFPMGLGIPPLKINTMLE